MAIVITARKRSLGQGNIFRSVCQEFCPRGGVCLSACWDTTHPSPQHPPWYQAPPPSRACWEIRSTSGRYASYWNAILLVYVINQSPFSRQYRSTTRIDPSGFRPEFRFPIREIETFHPTHLPFFLSSIL